MTRTDPSTAPSAHPDDAPPGRLAGAPGGYREVRVHGIGDHGPLSAQGSGEILLPDSGQKAAGITFSLPPRAPEHDARYLNWSRTSRSKVRLFWYVAFPYTLVNTAAFMCPRRGHGRQVHRVLVVAWGAVLTAVTVLWVVAAAETVLRFAAGGRGNTWISAGLPLAAGSLVPVVLVVRAIKHGARRKASGWDVPPGTLAVNLLAAVATVAAVGWWTPARSTVPARNGPGGAPCLLGPDGIDCVVYQGDWVTVAAFGTVSAAVLLLLVLAVASLVSQDTTWQGREASPLLGTGVALLAATVVLHVGWSSFLIAAQALLGYLDGWYFLPVLDDLGGSHPEDGLLLPFDAGGLVGGQTQAGYVYGPHLVAIVLTAPAVLLVLLAAVGVGLRVVERTVAGAASESSSSSVPGLASARRTHRWITATPGRTLTALAFAGALGWVLWIVGVGRFLADPPPLGAPSGLIAFLIVMRHLLLVAFLLLVFVGSLRRPLAVIGDVVGFWNISAHPLAALPYRDVVVSAIRNEIARPGRLALVGHSQGSVLCFTALLERAREADPEEPVDRRGMVNGHVDLVTCGSPLASLYGRFFPRFFGPSEMGLVNSSVFSWRNFWRDTDPIATAVDAKDGDIRMPDPPPPAGLVERPLRRHGDYWIAAEQTAWIEERASSPVAPPPGRADLRAGP